MATTGTGQGAGGTNAGASGMGTTDWNTSAGQQTSGERDRRAASEGNTNTSGITQTLRDTTYRSIDDQKSRASDTLGSLAGAVRGMTQPLRDGGQPQIAEYVNKAADGIERWASNLKQQDLEDGVRAVEQFARRQPAMFLGLAFGAGLVAARFLKSSTDDARTRHYGDFESGAGGSRTSLGSTGYGSTGYGSTGYGGSSSGLGGSTGAGSTGVGSTGSTGSTSGGGANTSTTGDIPRLSGNIRSSGEVL
jgi:hypothetical protein